jgi:hypothetical protein
MVTRLVVRYKKLFGNKVKIMIVIVLSVVVVRKKEPPLSSTDRRVSG